MTARSIIGPHNISVHNAERVDSATGTPFVAGLAFADVLEKWRLRIKQLNRIAHK